MHLFELLISLAAVMVIAAAAAWKGRVQPSVVPARHCLPPEELKLNGQPIPSDRLLRDIQPD